MQPVPSLLKAGDLNLFFKVTELFIDFTLVNRIPQKGFYTGIPFLQYR